MTITISNVIPLVEVIPDKTTANPCETISFSGSFFTDLGSGDTHTILWNFGDGTPLTSLDTGTATYSYRESGVYTVTLTVLDDDGGVGSASIEITVRSSAEIILGLIKDISSLSAPKKIEKELDKAIKQ